MYNKCIDNQGPLPITTRDQMFKFKTKSQREREENNGKTT